MTWFTKIRYSLRALVHRDVVERELDDELRFHIEQRIEELGRSGISPEEARRRALIEFGGVDQIKEECRDSRPLAFLNSLLQDLRFALRQMKLNPGFTTVAVLSLALAIGVSTVMFTIVNAVLLRHLPYPQDDQLVSLVFRSPDGEKSGPTTAEYMRLRQQSTSIAQWGAYFGGLVPTYTYFQNANNPRRSRIVFVTTGLLTTLGRHPLLGRNFVASDMSVTAPGQARSRQPRPIIISYALWQSQFGGDPKILNTVIAGGGLVVGILGPDFQLPSDLVSDDEVEVLALHPLIEGDYPLPWTDRSLYVVGRLKAGKQLSELRADAAMIAPRMRQERPDAYPPEMDWVLAPISLREDLVGDVRRILLLLMSAVGVVLLIACLNVANLLLARGMTRQREVAVRAAFGASRRRLVQQLFVESLLLVLLAAALGLSLAYWGLELTLSVTPTGALPRATEVTMEWRVLLFTIATSIAASLIFGLLPAFQASQMDLNTALREAGRSGMVGAARQRLRTVFVVAQVALAFLLVIGAGLLLRSFGKLMEVDPGFNPHNSLTARVSLPDSAYPTAGAVAAFFANYTQHMESLPGVVAASAVDVLPLDRQPQVYSFEVEGQEVPPQAPGTLVNFREVVPHYFEAIGMRLVRGRLFDYTDRPDGAMAVVINEAIARRFFPGEDPIGKRLRFLFGPELRGPWAYVIGVVPDAKVHKLNEDSEPELFALAAQTPQLLSKPNYVNRNVISLVIRFNSPATLTAEQFRNEIRKLDPSLATFSIEPVDNILTRAVVRPRFTLMLFGAFAAIAFPLAAIGVYGLVSFNVAQRTREFGIRIALGAAPGGIVRMVVWQGLKLALIGVGIGLAAALALTRLIRNMLYGVSPTDTFTYVAVSIVLMGVAALASYIPARRAARVDPMQALRAE